MIFRYFCIAQDANPTRWEYLRLIVTTLDQMERLFVTVERPFIKVAPGDCQPQAAAEEWSGA
jgi:hypothetical protein